MNIRRPAQILYAKASGAELSRLGRFVEGFNKGGGWALELSGIIGTAHHRPAYWLFTAAGIILNHRTNIRIRAHERAQDLRRFGFIREDRTLREAPGLESLVENLRKIRDAAPRSTIA